MEAVITLTEAKDEIMAAQKRRFKEYYASYFEREESQDLVNFFFERIYNLESQGDVIATAIKTFGKIKNKLPDEVRQSIQDVIDLNSLTHQLDEGMAELLLNSGWDGSVLTTLKLTEVYTAFGHKQERINQLQVMLETLKFAHKLAHLPLGKMLLGPAKLAARLFRVLPLFEFLEEGFYATNKVSSESFEAFYNEVEAKEWAYLRGALGE